MTSATPPRFAIVGAGISGLSAAQRFLADRPDCHVTLYEAQERTGGIIQTVHDNGYLLELGPDSFITNKPAAIRLCEEIGFSDELIPTDNQHRRSLVLKDGRPERVPDGFLLMAPSDLSAVATTPILSRAGRMRLLQESQIPPAESIVDESLGDFVRRRFGRETLERLVQPLVGGIYTSDPEKLSIKATLPRFQQMEQKYGSVTVGTLVQKARSTSGETDDPANNVTAESTASSGARYGLFAAPRKGMSDLVEATERWVCSHKNCQLKLGTKVDSIQPDKTGITVTLGDGTTEAFDGVVVTLPTHQAARLLPGAKTQTVSARLQEIEYASSSIVVSTHRLSDFEHPLDAFGLVIPMREQRNILAVSFSSRKFPGRAPDGHIILRTFVGGATQPELMEKTDSEIRAIVERELQDILGMRKSPGSMQVARYQQAMPQYHIGHLERVAAIEAELENLPRLKLAGSAYHGVGIPDSVASGQTAAKELLACLSNGTVE